MTRLTNNSCIADVAVLFSFIGAGPLHGIRGQDVYTDK